MKKLLILPMLAASLLHADQTSEELTDLFDESTGVVVRSKLNIDYTPSVLSVLHHDELQSLGVATLFEALGLLPGIETSITQNNHKKVTMRRQNLPNSYTYQKVKLVVDGVGIETAIYGNADYYLNFPVALIKRIEVLRGPGTSLYGTGAFNGVINVTTFMGERSAITKVFGGVGSDRYRMGGLNTHYLLEGDTELWIDGYYQSDDERIRVDETYVHDTIVDRDTLAPIAFTRPYEGVAATEDYALGMRLQKGALRFDARFKQDREGNLYGLDEYLEVSDDKRREERYLYTRLQYETALSGTSTLLAKAGYSMYRINNPAEVYAEPAQELFILSDLLLAERESAWYAEAELHYRGLDAHRLTLGSAFHSTRISDNNTLNYTSHPLLSFSGPLLPKNIKRDVSSLFVSDTIDLTSRLDLLASLRYDCYSDHDKGYPSLQLGAIYQEPYWRIKLNLAHAYKAPNWVELYALGMHNDLKAETNDGVDLIFIYEPSSGEQFKINGFYAKIRDIIEFNDDDATSGTYSYLNNGSRKSYGIEAEYNYRPNPSHRFYLNGSWCRATYVSTDDAHVASQVPDTTDRMFKATYIYYPAANVSIGGVLRYVGPRERQYYKRDWMDEALKSYTVADLALSYSRKETKLSLNVKNLFDEEVTYGSYYSFHDGIPGSGRQWYLNLEQRF